MRDQKVTVYGIFNNGTGLVTTALSVDNNGFAGVNLNLQGANIFSMNPFGAEFNIDSGLTDMLPVVNFQYLCGPIRASDGTNIFGRAKYASNESVFDPTASMMVAGVAGNLGVTDAPAANTQAQVQIGAVNQYVRVEGFGFTINAVAAITVPVLVTLVEDIGGLNITRWSGRYTCPAGQTIKEWISTPYALSNDATLTVAAPGATNFATCSMNASTTGNAPT